MKKLLGFLILLFSCCSLWAQSKNIVSGNFSSGYHRGFDEFDRNYAVLGAGVSYKLNPKISIESGLAYSYSLEKYEDPGHPDSLEDLELGMTYSDLFTMGKIRANSNLSLQLPTSRASQKSGMRFAPSLGMNFVLRLSRQFQFLQNNSYTYFNQEFDTADKAGLANNPVHAFSNSIGISLKIFKIISWSNLVGRYTYWDTASKSKKINYFSSQINFKFTKRIASYLKFSSKDRIVSNNSLFDDDNSVYGLGLVLNI